MKRITIACLLMMVILNLHSEPIKLGMSAVFSGPTKSLGINFYDGANAYFTYLNNSGGIYGEKIEIIKKDDTYNPQPCIENTISFIEQKDIMLLFNYVGTPTTVSILPLLKIYEDTGIILFGNFTGAGAQRTYPYKDYVFNIRSSYSQETNALVESFIKMGYEKIGIFYQIDGYGRSGYVGVELSLKNYNKEITREATYYRGSDFNTDMTVQAAFLKQGGVDAVICVGSYAPCSAFIRDARKAQFSGPIANISFVGTEALIDLIQKNNISLNNLYFSEVVPSYNDFSLDIVKEYRNILKEMNLEPSFGSFEGYINAKIIAKILKQVELEKINRKNIKTIIETMEPIDIGLGSLLSFSTENHQIFNKIYLYKLGPNGELEVLQ